MRVSIVTLIAITSVLEQLVSYSFLTALSNVNSARAPAGRVLPDPLAGKIVPSSGYFSLEELLQPDEARLVADRLLAMARLFPELSPEELEEAVDRSPVLLTVDAEALRGAVAALESALPLCSPSYVMQQRTAGVELLLAFLAGPQGTGLDVEGGVRALAAVLGQPSAPWPRADVLGFLRRCPFALLPKYQAALARQLALLQQELGLSRVVAVTAVEKFPQLLDLDLADSLRRLREGLAACNISADRAMLARVVRTVPRALVADVPRRLLNLRQLYPAWDLCRVVQGYPRALTQKYAVLDAHYQALAAEFSGRDGALGADDLVNGFPGALACSVVSLRAKLEALRPHLPSSDVDLLVAKHPAFLSFDVEGSLVPRIAKIQGLFARASRRGPALEDARAQQPAANLEPDTASPQVRLEGARYSAVELAREIARGWELQERGSELAQYDFTQDDGAPRYRSGGTEGASSASTEATIEGGAVALSASTVGSAAVVGDVHAAVSGGVSGGPDLSRLVAVNARCFLHQYSLFVRRVVDWVATFDEAAAYVLLTAAPHLLSASRPDKYHPIVKELYGYISRALAAAQQGDEEGQQAGQALLREAPAESPLELSATYRQLLAVVSDAPTVLRLTPAAFRAKVAALKQAVLPYSGVGGGEDLLLRCPRLLGEQPAKLAFACDALPALLEQCWDALAVPGSQRQVVVAGLAAEVVDSNPRVLAMPLAHLARIRFSCLVLGGSVAFRTIVALLPSLLDCNTRDYIRMLVSHTEVYAGSDSAAAGLAAWYSRHLEGLCATMTESAGVSAGPAHIEDEGASQEEGGSDDVEEVVLRRANLAEKRLCGLLNEAVESQDKGSLRCSALAKL